MLGALGGLGGGLLLRRGRLRGLGLRGGLSLMLGGTDTRLLRLAQEHVKHLLSLTKIHGVVSPAGAHVAAHDLSERAFAQVQLVAALLDALAHLVDLVLVALVLDHADAGVDFLQLARSHEGDGDAGEGNAVEEVCGLLVRQV